MKHLLVSYFIIFTTYDSLWVLYLYYILINIKFNFTKMDTKECNLKCLFPPQGALF